MYNVLEKLRSGAVLTAKEKAIHEQGLVSVLRQLHDDLDAAVFEAYGWSDLSCQGSGCQGSAKTNQPEPRTLNPDPAATILTRLVALNAERAAEEARGQVRWLRPEFQCRGASPVQSEMTVGGEEVATVAAKPAKAAKRAAWPTELPEQVQAVRLALEATAGPTTAASLASQFLRVKADRVAELLDTLVIFGQARKLPDGRYSGRV